MYQVIWIFLLFIVASKGRSHLLLRTPKERNLKKRNIPLYRDEEEKGEESDEDINAMKDEIKSLTQQLKEKDKEINKNEKYADLLSDLFQKGIIDSQGNFIDQDIGI